MDPVKLIGMSYRLGSDPVRHGTADCLSLARTVLDFHGFSSPAPARSWYRRLKQGDFSIFPEQLGLWGELVNAPKLGCVALCKADNGAYGLAVYWSHGWLMFQGPSGESEVVWSPGGVQDFVGLYYPQKQSSAMLLG